MQRNWIFQHTERGRSHSKRTKLVEVIGRRGATSLVMPRSLMTGLVSRWRMDGCRMGTDLPRNWQSRAVK